MFKLLFSLSITLFFSACLSNSSIILAQAEAPKTLDKSTIFKIAIPVREQGYSNFDTQVLTSKNALETFIKNIEKQKKWHKKENFLYSLRLYPIDFTKYNLFLYRMTKKSISTVLAVDAPKGTPEHILIEIGRDKADVGTENMAYYALAYKVAKSVKDITFDNGIKKHIIKNRSLSIQKAQE